MLCFISIRQGKEVLVSSCLREANENESDAHCLIRENKVPEG